MQQLMVEAGYTPTSARAHAGRAQKGLGFIELLEKNGCSNKIIANRLKDGLNARVDGKKDLMMRHRYVETVMKAKRLINDDTADVVSSLTELAEQFKGFDFEVLFAIKSRFASAVETSNDNRDS